jgi:hypothetical protein
MVNVTRSKFWPAMLMLASLALLAAATLSDQRFKVATILLLAMFAAKIAIAHKRGLREGANKSQL